MNLEKKQTLYVTAKAAKRGEQVDCPACGKPFTKVGYQQAFCSNSGSGNCKDAYWSAVRAPKPEQPAPVAQEPTAEQRAIEHAEYLAVGADQVFEAFNVYGSALTAIDEADIDTDLSELHDQLEHAMGELGEALGRLRGYAYEFRKRAARAKAGVHE